VSDQPDISQETALSSGHGTNDEALKLTSYFGERSQIKGRLLADELLDIHARHEIRSSILLRGIQGFGGKHRLRSDRLLTLSEDLPLVSVAVDIRERIEALCEDVSSIQHDGLITLERAQLRGAGDNSSWLPQLPAEAVKLTVYIGRYERVNGAPAFTAVCQALHDRGVAGATVLLGVDGTRDGRRQRARFFARNVDVPLMVMAVGDSQKIAETLIHLEQILHEPLFTIERVRVCKRDGVLLDSPHDQLPAGTRLQSRQKLTIVISEAAREQGRSVYLELVRRLRAAGAAGATSLRGIWGFHGDHAPHGDRLLSIRRHVPVVTVVIDAPDRIATLFGIVDELTYARGLVTSELVPPPGEAPHL
jgi:PII-like signaling protein